MEDYASRPRFYPGWLVVAAAFCGVAASYGPILVFTFGIFLKPLDSEFGWGRESISTAFSIAAITVAVCAPALGWLLDRLGSRRVVLTCMTLYGLTVASLSLLTPSLAHLYAASIVVGVVGNGTTQMGYAHAVSSWFTDRRGAALGLVVSAVGVGSIVFPVVAQRLIDFYGWRVAYLVLGGVALAMGLPLTALFVRERPSEGEERVTTADGQRVSQALRSRGFWLLGAMLFLSSLALNGAVIHLSPLLTDRGIDPDLASLAVSVLGGASLGGRLFTGYLLDRYSGATISFGLLAGAAAGLLLLATVSRAGGGLVAAALIGLGLGGEADVTPYLLARYFGLRSLSTLYGLMWTAYAIGGAIGPVLMGRAFDATRSYTHLLTLLSGVTLISALLMLLLPAYPSLERLRGPGESGRVRA